MPKVPSNRVAFFLVKNSSHCLVLRCRFPVHFGAMTTRAERLRQFLFSVSMLRIFALVLGVISVFWICTFKIMDRDFWWHIKAGEIMLQTHHLIATDSFAYARAGLPYLATHEWLAQIILYLVYHTGGFIGIILFRGVIATASVGLLYLLAKKPRVAYTLLAVWAVVMTKGSYLERPQLFTFILFAAFILLAFRFLDAESERVRRWICGAFIALELLWVNMHGGAALVGCALIAFLFLQTAFTYLQSRSGRAEKRQTLLLLFGTGIVLGITLILPPNGLGTITYLRELLTDKTIAFIAEWQPRDWLLYVSELWPFFVLSIVALLMGKRHWIFNALLLLMTVYLSRQALRHEILFVYASIATCFYQLDRSDRMDRVWAWLAHRRVVASVVTIIVVLLLARHAVARSYAFERQDNLFGFGQFDLARGATDFIEREKITGNMFNTYGIGGYLIYRGYPDRKVFIDGRNVDYGFDYMARAYAAGINPERWKELVDTYNITYAIVDYDAIKAKDSLPYSSILDKDPDWATVYLDDWVAVYLKRTPENQPLIDRLQYKYVNASTLQFHDDFLSVKDTDIAQVITELQRIQKNNPEGIKATVALAKIALHQKRFDDVQTLAAAALKIRPYNPEPLALLAGVYLEQEKWDDAAQMYTKILQVVGDNYPNMDYIYIANVFEKAGHPWKAWYYRLGSRKAIPPVQITGSGSLSSEEPSMMVNPAADALDFSNQGLAQAESGQMVEAEQSFRTSLKINPGAEETWNNLCALLLNLKRTEEAIDACKHAITINQLYGDAHYNLALAYYNTGAFADAKKEALIAQKNGHEKESTIVLQLIQQKQQ